MDIEKIPDNFYEKIKANLYQRVGKELRLAYRVLDLGCGNCGLAQYLAETYCQKITGVDISDRSFPVSRNIRGNNKNIRCIRKDAAHLGFIQNETMDAVVIFWALHEMKNSQEILQEVHRFLRPGGKVLIVEFPRNSLAQKLWNEKYYTGRELENFLRKAGFEDTKVKLIEHKQILWINAHRGAN